MYVYINIRVFVCVCVYIYIYIYAENELSCYYSQRIESDWKNKF